MKKIAILLLVLCPVICGAVTRPDYVQIKNAPVFDVRQFGAKGDGSTDDAPAIAAAVASASASDAITKYVYLPPTESGYKMESQIQITASGVWIIGNDTLVTWAGSGEDSLYEGVFEFKGSLGDDIATLAVDIPEYGYIATLTAMPSTVAKGDIWLGYVPGSPTVAEEVYSRGLFEVCATSGVLVGFEPPAFPQCLQSPAAAGGAYTFKKITPVENCGIKGLRLVATGQTVRSNGMGGIYAQYAKNLVIKDCSFTGFWFKGVFMLYCYQVLIENCQNLYPAATGGGEGYAIGGEYNAYVWCERIIAVASRHCVDMTASSHYWITDCVAKHMLSASFTTHKAYEDHIFFTNCVVDGGFGDAGFALVNTGTGFADVADNIHCLNCRVINQSQGPAFQCVGLGQNYSFLNCVASLTPTNTSSGFVLSDNGSMLSNCTSRGKIYVVETSSRSVSLPVYINNCDITAGPNNRSMQSQGTVNIYVRGGSFSGSMNKSASATWVFENVRIQNSSGSSLMLWTGEDLGVTVGKTSFKNCVFGLYADPGIAHAVYSKKVIFDNCDIGHAGSGNRFVIGAKQITIRNNRGDGKFRSPFATATAILSSGNISHPSDTTDGYFLRLDDFTGELTFTNNHIVRDADTTSAVSALSGNGNAFTAVFNSNYILGNVQLSGMATGTIVGNVIDSTTAYPASSSGVLEEIYNVDPNP